MPLELLGPVQVYISRLYLPMGRSVTPSPPSLSSTTMPHSTPMNRQESAATIDEKHGAQHLEAGAGQELPTVMEAKELANEGDDAAQALEG
jgi:hypothetical protein